MILSQDNTDQALSVWAFNTEVFKGLAFHYLAHWSSPAQEETKARISITEGLKKFSKGKVCDGLQ